MMRRRIGSTWKSRAARMWASAISWMRWSHRRRERRQEQELKVLRRELELRHLMLLEALEAALPPLLNKAVQEQFMLMLSPLVAALQRQDQQAVQNQEELKELLTEVLNSLHPTPRQQLLSGTSRRQPSSPTSEVSARP